MTQKYYICFTKNPYPMKDPDDLIIIEKIKQSRLPETDLSDIKFGTIFTDHMFIADYRNGRWEKPKIIPYQALPMAPSAKVLHYGQAVFEGMKAYKDAEGNVFLFRPDKNMKRLNRSAERLAMPTVPEEYFMAGLKKLVELDQDWIPAEYGSSLYLRPVYYAISDEIAASPSQDYRFVILASPAQAYYTGDVKVKVEEHYSRACSGGVGFAKAAGNYAAQFLATEKAKKEGFKQIIWTDSKTHEFVEEAGTMNLFFRIDDTLITAPTSDRILHGVTRESIIRLAEDNGMNVEVRRLTVDEVMDAARGGRLMEIFGSGTAATVLPITGIGYRDEYYELPEPQVNYASRLKKMLMDIQYNRAEDPYGWRVPVVLKKQ